MRKIVVREEIVRRKIHCAQCRKKIMPCRKILRIPQMFGAPFKNVCSITCAQELVK